MDNIYHIPAMLQECIEGLNIQPAGVYVDVTFGGGGHSGAILRQLAGSKSSKGSKLYSFDQDIEAYENQVAKGTESPFIRHPQWQFVHSNFRYLRNFMDYYGVSQINGLIADLGVSFHHFDEAERGFSFRFAGPLDMRMNKEAQRTAADIINTYSEEDLARIFYLYGELNNGRQLAHRIVAARQAEPINRIERLVAIATGERLEDASLQVRGERLETGAELDIEARYKKDLAKLFQALRIEVNDELGALQEMLVAARDLLAPNGRIVILTYHSLEDRIVKNFLRSGNLEGNIEKDFYGNIITPFRVLEKGATASEEEVARNPRARSAKLRIAEKC